MTTQEIKTLINTTLADIGNQAPWGGVLNKILNGLVDLSSNQTNILDLPSVIIEKDPVVIIEGTMEEIANTLNITKEEADNLYHGKYVQVCPRQVYDNTHHVVCCFLNEVIEEYSDSGREVKSVEYYNSENNFYVEMRRIGDFTEDSYVLRIGIHMA